MREMLNLPAVVALTSDLSSFRRFWRPDGKPVRVRALNGHGIVIRPGTSDATVLRDALATQSHLPPIASPKRIWDLGSNIGVTIAHMAVLHPTAQITGLELDPANYAIATENITPWADRCRVIRAAAWTEDGEVRFRHQAGYEAGSRIADEGEPVPALSLNSLAEITGTPDYVKMDVEGAEKELLRVNTEWAQGVRSLKVEIHGAYHVEDCAQDLAALGFKVDVLPPHWWPPSRGRPCLVGMLAD